MLLFCIYYTCILQCDYDKRRSTDKEMQYYCHGNPHKVFTTDTFNSSIVAYTTFHLSISHYVV